MVPDPKDEEQKWLETLVHDLKTPLATIRALAQLCAMQLRAKGDATMAARLDKVDVQVERVRLLLRDALEARQNGQAALDPEEDRL